MISAFCFFGQCGIERDDPFFRHGKCGPDLFPGFRVCLCELIGKGICAGLEAVQEFPIFVPVVLPYIFIIFQ